MINIKFITTILGKIVTIEGIFMLLCAIMAFAFNENDSYPFLFSGVGCIIIGIALSFIFSVKDKVITKKDGYFIVASTWLIFSIFGCIPYMLSGAIPHFADAFFEAMSGFTTTGSTILNNIEEMPHATLFWRSLTQWLGGLGIVMLFIALLPGLGVDNADLYTAEVPGITHSKTSSTFKSMARNLWKLYIALTIINALFLFIGGMNIFDAVCHSFTTMSTGGFSTKQASIAHWGSSYIEYVTIFFMFIAGTNFTIIYTTIQTKKNHIFKDAEFRIYAFIVIATTIVLTTILYLNEWNTFETSFRDALFQVVSIITSTGFGTADYLLWPTVLGSIIFLLMFIGGSAGSTAGGIKVGRIMLLFKNSLCEMKRIIHPNAVINVKYNKKSLPSNVMDSIMAFFIMYMLLFGISTFIMTLATDDFQTAYSSTITCISNIGPGFGSVGPASTFANLNDFSKIFLSLLMMIGRLEVFTVLVLFTKDFWKR